MRSLRWESAGLHSFRIAELELLSVLIYNIRDVGGRGATLFNSDFTKVIYSDDHRGKTRTRDHKYRPIMVPITCFECFLTLFMFTYLYKGLYLLYRLKLG